MAAPKFEFRSILTRNLLDPARHKGSPFTFVHCRDTKEVFFTDAEGNYINFGSILAAVMTGSLPLALPASPVAGPSGPAGRDGATGSQGPIGLTGATGPAGPKGDIFIPTDSELAAEVAVIRKAFLRAQARLFSEMQASEHLGGTARFHVQTMLKKIRKELDL